MSNIQVSTANVAPRTATTPNPVRFARITFSRPAGGALLAKPTGLSLTRWSEKRQILNAPARLSELVASLSPEGQEAFEEAHSIIEQRLKRKLLSGEVSRLAFFRSQVRMTQVRLAEVSGIPQPNISKLERTGRMSLRMAEKLAPALGISVGELLGLREEPEK